MTDREVKHYYTALIKYDRPDDMPRVHSGMEALGGKVIAVYFDDMFEELDRARAERDEARTELATLRAQNYETQSLLAGAEAYCAALRTALQRAEMHFRYEGLMSYADKARAALKEATP